MKKFGFISLAMALVVLAMFSQVFADVVTTRKIAKPQPQSQTQQVPRKTQTSSSTNLSASTTRMVNKVKTCTPYSESNTFDVGGRNVKFNIKILGWVNGKCRMDFTSDTAGISSSFQSLYGVEASNAEIYSFAPKFSCGFTKQQLAEVGDSILQEEARKNGGKMLKNPNEIDILSLGQMSSNDMKLMSMLTDGQTCQMLNTGDVNKIIESLFGY